MSEKITVVIPAYNEARKVEPTINEVKEFLVENGYSFEIIIVDDGSDDNTLNIVKRYKAINSMENIIILENNPNRGKGYAVRRGIMEANGDYVLFMDADNATRIFEMEKMLPYFENIYDVVIGS